MPSRSNTVETLIRNAHRRTVLILAAEQAAIVGSCFCAGAAVILLLGTQLLNWYWLALLALASTAACAWRLQGRLPTPYKTAQTLDWRLSLHDTISTAWHLNRTPALAETDAGQEQLRQAELMAAKIDTRAAVPFRFHRVWILTLVLAVVALALFSVRYLVRHDLRFEQSLIPVRFDRLTALLQVGTGQEQGASQSKSDSKDGQSTEQQLASMLRDEERTGEVVGTKNPFEARSPGQSRTGDTADNLKSDVNAGEGEPSGNNGAQPGNRSTPKAQEHASGGDTKRGEQGSRSQSNDGQDNESLSERMKDAVSSFLAKLKPDQASQSAQASTRNAAAPDQDQSQREGGKPQNQSSSSQQSAQTNSKTTSNSAQQGQATEMTDSAQSRSSSASEHKSGAQAKSGVGKQDGGKELRDAQEAQAMGKLAEIIGKRSHDVSGEMMVDVPSGKQDLKTAYTGKIAQHSDSGGEINRDEVPVALQEYVREYMQRVHRQPEPKH